MKAISINTTKQVVPMIYAYTTPEIARHDGWTKIGYTEQDIDKRLKQQMHTADVEWNLEWRGNAVFDDNGIIQKGVIIRHLVLPNHIQNTKNILSKTNILF